MLRYRGGRVSSERSSQVVIEPAQERSGEGKQRSGGAAEFLITENIILSHVCIGPLAPPTAARPAL